MSYPPQGHQPPPGPMPMQGQPSMPGQPPMPGMAPVPAPGQAMAPAGTAAQMKRRNPFAAWLGLPIITFGIYGLVWFYMVHDELRRYDQRTGANPTTALLSVLLGFLTFGIWPLVVWVQLGGRIAAAQRAAGLQPSCSGGVGFILGIIGFGTLYYQLELNKIIDRYEGAPVGAPVPLYA